MGDVIRLDPADSFRLEEARAVVEILRRVTGEAVKEFERLRAQHDGLDPESAPARRLRERMDETVREWSEKVERLGGLPKGLWLVDFDSGRGFYWCWRYPEAAVEFVHDYDSGFSGRRPIGPAELDEDEQADA